MIASIAYQLGWYAFIAWEQVHVAESLHRTLLKALLHHLLSTFMRLFWSQLPAASVTSALRPHTAVAKAKLD